MQRIYRFAFLFITFFSIAELKAQRYAFDEGSVRFGVSLNYANRGGELYQPIITTSNLRIESDRVTEFSLRPSVAYFIFEGLAVGVEGAYETFGQNDVNNVVAIASATSWGVGPSVAYFFGGRQTSVLPFLSASYVYQSASREEFLNNLRTRLSGTNLRVAAGLAVMFGKHAALNFEAFFRMDQREIANVGSRRGNLFGIDIGASLFIF